MSFLDAFLEDGLEESMVNATGPKEVWFAIRTDGQKGSGTSNDPYNGADRDQFDQLMNAVPEGTTIHLGPGVFQTRGGYGNGVEIARWAPKSGQRIVGSGMFATTLKLVLDPADTNVGLPPGNSRMFYAIGSQSGVNLDSYEICDLTVDCNLAGQPDTVVNGQSIGYARVNCCAIRLFGTNLHVHRVRVINWGGRNSYLESFPLVIGKSQTPPQYSAETLSNVIEDCLVEQPDWNTGDQATLVSAQVIRNCFIRGDRVRPGPFPQIPVLSLTYSGNRVTLTTPFAHQFIVADRVAVRGVLINGQPSTLFNGNFAVDAVPSPKILEYLLPQSGSGTPTGTITVERESKLTLQIKSLQKLERQDVALFGIHAANSRSEWWLSARAEEAGLAA